MTRHDPDLAARLYARKPDIDAMRARLPDLGAALDAALCGLSKDISIENIDQVLLCLKGAEASLLHLRRGLAAEMVPGPHGHGTG